KALLARGVPLVLNHKVRRLLVDSGRVAGVESADGRKILATKGVVIATGGYEWNADLMRDFDPLPGLEPLSPPSLTGDGLIMAAVRHADACLRQPPLLPDLRPSVRVELRARPLAGRTGPGERCARR